MKHYEQIFAGCLPKKCLNSSYFNMFNLFYCIFFTIEKYLKLTHSNFTIFTPKDTQLYYVYIFT